MLIISRRLVSERTSVMIRTVINSRSTEFQIFSAQGGRASLAPVFFFLLRLHYCSLLLCFLLSLSSSYPMLFFVIIAFLSLLVILISFPFLDHSLHLSPSFIPPFFSYCHFIFPFCRFFLILPPPH